MNMSASTSFLYEIESGGEMPIPAGKLAFFQARLRNRLYDFILEKFEGSELTRAQLARRIGRRPEIITRLLASPGNWTLDTVSDLLLGIAGEELQLNASAPAGKARRNYREPEWLSDDGQQPIQLARGNEMGMVKSGSAVNNRLRIQQIKPT
jgi:hypothetical protein